ncbi:ABC transporter substrate-binding protein [Brevibacterium yomogidense]|uniref:ABC transporter (Iron.B12.siderophore.hemin), periplasmic substrate-binding component n=1 Tax=Brevibacterium yomogidense TaxID=946573 RepID=A0A1X6WUU0_9MICO|nr:ABC transporter substrate-binding protein [Brevibacterium yomogidense]SLM89073.1 ABC transporter (iron.B12.siderophore.hemin), periplasmic substrate-binding component [Brevibacterium yomogidense]
MSPHPRPTRPAGSHLRTLVLAAASGLVLSACGAGDTAAEAPAGSQQEAESQQEAGSQQYGDGQPVTVTNCGAEVTFESPPERLVLLKSAPVAALHALGVLDRAVARAGAYPEEYWDADTHTQLEQIPELTSNVDGTGHLHISKDVVIAQEPDVVFGEVENLPRSGLADLGIPVLEEPLLCTNQADTSPDFADVGEQMRLYGEVFDEAERADEVADGLAQRVDAVRTRTEDAPDRTAAVLYPTVGGGTTYAYGTGSMAQAQLEAAGFANVFGEQRERVFEVTAEQLLGRDPDVVILLHSDGDPQAVEQSLAQLPGADQLTAVQDGTVMAQLLHFSEPATPLAVDGLEQIAERFDR